jgi:hypothetical protein
MAPEITPVRMAARTRSAGMLGFRWGERWFFALPGMVFLR